MALIRKKEGFIRTPPNRYGPTLVMQIAVKSRDLKWLSALQNRIRIASTSVESSIGIATETAATLRIRASKIRTPAKSNPGFFWFNWEPPSARLGPGATRPQQNFWRLFFQKSHVANPPTCYRSLSGPSGPKCPESVPEGVPENGGVGGSVRRGVPGGPRLRSVQKVSRECPRSVKKVSGTLRGHSRDTFWTLRSLGPKGPRGHPVGHSLGHPRFRGHPRGHSRDTSGPKGPRDSCTRSGGVARQV